MSAEHEATATRAASSVPASTPEASLTSASTMSAISDLEAETPRSSPDAKQLANSIGSIVTKLDLSPQTIPETSSIDHSITQLSPVEDLPRGSISRNSSSRSIGMPRTSRINTAPGSRRASRRSTSGFSSASPAQAFLSGWARSEADDPAPEPKPDDEGQSIGLQNEFVIGSIINRGAFGVVKEVHSIDAHGHRTTCAVKIVTKTIANVSDEESEKVQLQVEHEVSVWRYLTHPHVLKLHSVYDTDYATFCVMDLNVGGTLHDMVRRSRHNASNNDGRRGLPPHLAKTYAYQLACALRYLHEDIRICHRDVKLENCLVDLSAPNAEEEGGILRLCDFGLADFLHSDQSPDDTPSDRRFQRLSLSSENPVFTAASVIGTLEYASPKGLIVNRKLFETAGDVWAFGVVVYALCTGDLPFKHTMPSKTADLIIRAEWDENALREAAAGSDEVIDLVKGCLERAIEDRFTISDALRSPWFEDCREESEEEASHGVWN